MLGLNLQTFSDAGTRLVRESENTRRDTEKHCRIDCFEIRIDYLVVAAHRGSSCNTAVPMSSWKSLN